MTEEQMTLIKTLIKKHGISATDGENARPDIRKAAYRNNPLHKGHKS